MWITSGKSDLASAKDILFHDLHSECKSAAPGARLSYPLRSRLEKCTLHDRRDVVLRKRDGQSPLFIACKKGNSDIVEYLIDVCGADVEQRGLYEVPDDRSVHFVTPLWCAAVAGKINVVKSLVQRGAGVNSVSDTGSTPVRSACFMTHLDIVKYLVEHGADILRPNYNGGTCLINAVQSVPLCQFLLSHNANVNAQDIQCKTALHYAIQEHRHETTQLLLQHHADPLIKSRYGDDALQTACLKGAAQIFDLLLNCGQYSRQRIADAHELLGATYLDEHHDLPIALQYWRKALVIRASDDTHPPIVKAVGRTVCLCEKDPPNFVTAYDSGYLYNASTDSPMAAVCNECQRPVVSAAAKSTYGDAVEFQTLEELESVATDLDALRTQSLLICERILGPLHKDMIFRLMFRGAAYADSMQYQRCISLWRYALELRIHKDSLLHSEACFTLQALVRLFLDLQQKHTSLLSDDVRYQDVIETIELIASQLPEAIRLLRIQPVYKRQLDNFDRLLRVLSHLLYIIRYTRCTSEQVLHVKRVINRIIHIDPRMSQGDSLLHLAVSKGNFVKANSFFDDQQTNVFPSSEVTTLLLECGMSPNLVNHNNSTPLHVAAAPVNFCPKTVSILLDCGAHIDQRNDDDERAHCLLAENPECTLNPLRHITLRCLAARVLANSKRGHKNVVPASLRTFVSMH